MADGRHIENHFSLPGAPKKYPLKNFAKFSRTIEIWYKILHTGYPFNYP